MNNYLVYTRKSLELHLFFSRIMKEHSFFLQLGFTPKDAKYAEKADEFRKAFDKLLCDVVLLSDGVVSNSVLKSGEIITPFTLKAEEASEFYTGVDIATDITKSESKLSGAHTNTISRSLLDKVSKINKRAISLVCELIEFKSKILENVRCCKMFTLNYPLLIDHIMREAKLYLDMIRKLQSGRFVDMNRYALEQEAFWNRIMGEHAMFIRGLLDPTEEELFNIADAFGDEFKQLTKAALSAMDKTTPFCEITLDSLRATEDIRDFKCQATEGLLDCKIKSIILPLLGDHTLREANHFLRLLQSFENQ